MEKVILVDRADRKKGIAEKMEAHRKGILHRAFSILIFNKKGEMLLQQRARSKYHSGGLWTNACCSHPRPGEKMKEAIHRRLKEEMGFDCPLKEVGSFIYKVNLDKGLMEHEFDHVFIGYYNGKVRINKREAERYKWVSLKFLEQDIKKNPRKYTEWFKIILKKLKRWDEKIKRKSAEGKNGRVGHRQSKGNS